MATQASKLLSLLFDKLPTDRPLQVLDIGGGSADTLAFFGQYRCRLHYANLLDEAVVRELQEDATEQELQEQFTGALALPGDTQLDICLFWDIFSYLDGPALCAFVTALRPYVHERTRSHGFGMLNAKAGLNHNEYGIRSEELISYRRRAGAQPAVYPHSQRELNQLLGHFHVATSRLMVDGHTEFVLRYDREHKAEELQKSVFNF
jgi:hypothetical protein